MAAYAASGRSAVHEASGRWRRRELTFHLGHSVGADQSPLGQINAPCAGLPNLASYSARELQARRASTAKISALPSLAPTTWLIGLHAYLAPHLIRINSSALGVTLPPGFLSVGKL